MDERTKKSTCVHGTNESALAAAGRKGTQREGIKRSWQGHHHLHHPDKGFLLPFVGKVKWIDRQPGRDREERSREWQRLRGKLKPK